MSLVSNVIKLFGVKSEALKKVEHLESSVYEIKK